VFLAVGFASLARPRAPVPDAASPGPGYGRDWALGVGMETSMFSNRITYRTRKVHGDGFRTFYAEFWVETWWLLGIVPVFRRETLTKSNV
jgi:hypothetical protein